VGHKSHDPCLHVFLMEKRVMNLMAHCTFRVKSPNQKQTFKFTQSHANKLMYCAGGHTLRCSKDLYTCQSGNPVSQMSVSVRLSLIMFGNDPCPINVHCRPSFHIFVISLFEKTQDRDFKKIPRVLANLVWRILLSLLQNIPCFCDGI